MLDLSPSDSVLLPALVGISSVLVVIAGLYWLQSSRLYTRHFTAGGTHTEINEDGAAVRRSNRERKSVARWSPDDLSSPTGMATPEKAAQSSPVPEPQEKRTVGRPRKSAAVAPPAASETPPKRPRGRPPKTPKAEADAPKSARRLGSSNHTS